MRRMMKASMALAAFMFAGTIVGLASEAKATVILAGSDGSTFSGCSACGSGTTSTSLNLGGFFTLAVGGPGGTPITFSASGNTTNLELAAITLTETAHNPTASQITFNYNLLLNFTTPSGTSSEAFHITANASGTGAGSQDVLSGLTLSLTDPLVLSNGATLSNFHFVDSGAAGSFSSGTWTLQGNTNATATLELVANVTAPSAVPEPTSLAVLGTALAGFGAIRRRRGAGV